MQSSKPPTVPSCVRDVALVHAACRGWDVLTAQVSTMIGHETHARTLRSIQDAVEAIGSASTLSLSLVATVLAAAHGILPAAASLRLQRLLNNPKLDLEERGYAYVRSVIGERREL